MHYRTILTLCFLLSALILLADCSPTPANHPAAANTPNVTTAAQSETPTTPASPAASTPSPTPAVVPVDLSQFHNKWIKALTKAAYLNDKTDALAMLSGKNGEALLTKAVLSLKENGLPEGKGLSLDNKQFAASPKGQGGQAYSATATWNFKDGKMCSTSTIAYTEGKWSITGWGWKPCESNQDTTPPSSGG